MEVQAFKFLAVGLLGVAFGGAAIGVGRVFAAALEGIARNPSAESNITKYKSYLCLLLIKLNPNLLIIRPNYPVADNHSLFIF